MRVLFHPDVLLDGVCEHSRFGETAQVLFESSATGRLAGWVAAFTIADVYARVRQHPGSEAKARSATPQLLGLMQICPVDRPVLEQALAEEPSDFAIALLQACATVARLEAGRSPA